MRVIQVFLYFMLGLSALFMIGPLAHSQSDGEKARKENVPRPVTMETVTIQNVRYLLPTGTIIRKRAGVITFEGPGEYTARRLADMEKRLRENEIKLKRLERLRRQGE